jgi:hypothetical protein
MNKSDSIAALAAALSKAQAQIEGAIKDSTNPHFKSKYADLSSVVDAIRKPLAANGLAYVQTINQADNAASVSTLIMHASGEWIDCGAIAVPVSKADAQGYGSALTYARRYSLSAAFGVAPEDDDGNAAAKATPVKPKAEASVEMLAKATQAASNGIDAYKAFWSGLSVADRGAIGDSRHADFKAMAKEADAVTA